MDKPDLSQPFGLYLILTNPVAGYEACAVAAVQHKVRLLQLRMKTEPKNEVLAMAKRLREITRGSETLFVVNDYVDIAAAVDADGVHVGQDDTALDAARRMWPAPGKIFGLSTHSEAQEAAARDQKPDYIGVGPVFTTPTKDIPDPTVGMERMGGIIQNSPLPCVAIGGIDPQNLPEVLAHGAKNFAVVRAVNAAADPGPAIEKLQTIWKRAMGGG